VADSSSEIDPIERQLFATLVVDRKVKRVSQPRCPECGRRGYHVKVCRRSLLTAGAPLINELELRWAYVARLAWSNNDVRTIARASSRVITKGGRPLPR